MNRKTAEKIISITLSVISFMFVLLLLITTFGHIENADLNNKIVKALLISLTFIFGILSAFNIGMAFKDTEKLQSVLIFKDKQSSTQATVSVMKRTVVRVCKEIEDAKIRRVHIFADEVGNVKMKIDIKVYSNETVDVTTRVKATLIDTFEEVFGIEFSSIDFRITKSKNTYKPTDAEVEKRVKELKESLVLNKPVAVLADDEQSFDEETDIEAVEELDVEIEETNADEHIEDAVNEEAEVIEDEVEDNTVEEETVSEDAKVEEDASSEDEKESEASEDDETTEVDEDTEEEKSDED